MICWRRGPLVTSTVSDDILEGSREVNVSLGNWLINSGIRAAEVSHRWNRLSTASVTIGVVCPTSGSLGVSHHQNHLPRRQEPPASVTIGIVCLGIRHPWRQSPSESSASTSGTLVVRNPRRQAPSASGTLDIRHPRHQSPSESSARRQEPPTSNITKTAAMGQLLSKMVMYRRYRRMVSSRSGPTEMMLTGQPVSLSMKAT